MNVKETIRYATLGAAAALLVSGGIYAGSALQAQQFNARAGDGYSGNFDYVQKHGGAGSPQDAGPADGPDPASAEDAKGPVTGDAPPDSTSNEPAATASSEAPTAAEEGPSPAPGAPAPTSIPSPEAQDGTDVPTQDQGAAAEEPAGEPEPAEAPADAEPAADPEPAPADDPAGPGGGGVTPGPAIFKAINPCLLVKCDPPPPPGKLTLDPCLVNQCAVAEDEPVFVPTIDYSKLPSLQLDLRK
jgi:hypothetical protein